MTKKNVVKWFVRVFNKEMCTSSQLQRACNYVITYCKQDADGIITLAEAIEMLVKAFREVKKGN